MRFTFFVFGSKCALEKYAVAKYSKHGVLTEAVHVVFSTRSHTIACVNGLM